MIYVNIYYFDKGELSDQRIENPDGIYLAKNGLTVAFIKEPENNPDEKIYQMAIVQVSDRTGFLISSSLPREQVKKLIEDLVLVK
jgi:hypothetical protein